MKKITNIIKINSYFTRIKSDIERYNCLGLYDINKIIENICIPILKELYDCPQLINLNTIENNYPAIDLGCAVSKKAFQITSDASSTKIISTIEKFLEYSLQEKFTKIKVFIITKKQKSYTSKKLNDIAKKCRFVISEDIIDFTDLLKIIASKEAIISDKVLDILTREFEKVDKFASMYEGLDKLNDISLGRIENEKRTKKYIPNIFGEVTSVKDNARIFSNPKFFFEKAILAYKQIDLSLLNYYLEKLEIEPIKIEDDFLEFDSCREYGAFMDDIEKKENILNEHISKIIKFKTYTNHDYDEIVVPKKKEKLKDILKYKIGSESYYIEKKLDEIAMNLRLMQARIFLITSFAGQGKTNFLCDFSEKFCNAHKIPFIYIPARELNRYAPNFIADYIKNNSILASLKDKFEFFEFAENVSTKLETPFLLVIDGINEIKDCNSFENHLIDFLSAMMQYNYVKLIISCRSEFFEKKFNYFKNSVFEDVTYKIENLKNEFSQNQLNRILSSYFSFFNINISKISEDAKESLVKNFLLLRIFCESNKDANIEYINDIYKVELFEKYLIDVATKTFELQKRKCVIKTLFKLVYWMLSNDNYTNISLGLCILDNQETEIIEQLVNEDVILRRELPVESLMELGSEQVNFTYDELRDFIIAYYFLQNGIEKEELLSLENKPIYEGAVKFLYLLLRIKEGKKEIIYLIEELPDFHALYTESIFSIKNEFHNENDILIIQEILADWRKSQSQFINLALTLLRRKNTNDLLNISIFTDFIKRLDDNSLTEVISLLLTYENINGIIFKMTSRINNYDSINNLFLIFCFQILPFASIEEQSDFIFSVKNIDGSSLKNILNYLGNSKSMLICQCLSKFTN